MPTDSLVRTLLNEALSQARAVPRPESTYRLQFHKGFTFKDAAAIVPYLRDLGITHVYASPYLKAAAGSTHGYDVIDHNLLNPELGTQADYDALLDALQAHGLSHILDTVPNHAGVATNENPWWNDVLLHGPASAYASSFDIAWQGSPRPELHDKLLLPLLGAPYAEVLEKGELRLTFEENGAFLLHYYERHFPINPGTIPLILAPEGAGQSSDDIEYNNILAAANGLPPQSARDPQQQEKRRRDTVTIHQRLADLAARSRTIRKRIDAGIAAIHGTPSDPHSFDRLDNLLNAQAYRLTFWRNASDEINYRRFFDINDLAALSMQHEHVFLATHDLLLQLLAEGKIAGLRIDHPDGLYDPAEYFRRLQFHYVLRCARKIAAGDARFRTIEWPSFEAELSRKLAEPLDQTPNPAVQPLYVSIEKILAIHEELPPAWPIDGTSGYDFLIHLNGLYVDPTGKEPLTRIYEDFIGGGLSFEEHVYQDKRLILETALSSELHMLAHDTDRLSQRHRHWRDFTPRVIRNALREVIACFPVYRSYITGPGGVSAIDERHLRTATAHAQRRNPSMEPAVLAFLADLILQHVPDAFTPDDRAAQARFAGKFQQLTAPVTAKGIEDTAFYRYHRLISLNEVGGDPDTFGISPDGLHAYFADRQARWPYALSALSTHDTKRSEDVRARLHALSELPDEWRARVNQWRAINATVRPEGIAPNDEYLLYQTLLGAWPLEGEPDETFTPRIQAYMIKALRESKVSTAWTDPNEQYETAIKDYVTAVIRHRPFLADFLPFERRIAHVGLLTSLSQTLVRLTAPGVPDTYQGTELWDFSLVDPDNRRPVDYAIRRSALETLSSGLASVREMLRTNPDDRLKLLLTTRALSARRVNPGLFSRGAYIPLKAQGPLASHVFAFIRQHEEKIALIIAPRLLARITPDDTQLPLGDIWKETTILIPPEIPASTLRNPITGKTLQLARRVPLSLAEALRDLPFALCVAE